MKLSAKAFGLAAGLIWGVSLLLGTLLAHYYGYFESQLNFLVGLYPWYEISPGGAVIGFVDGFLDAGIGAFVFALVYNAFVKCCGMGCCTPKSASVAASAPATPARKSIGRKPAKKLPARKTSSRTRAKK